MRTRSSIGREIKYRAWDKTLGCCWYCGFEMIWGDTRAKRHPNLEHMTPVAQGGTDVLENLVYACWTCNSEKRDLRVDQYRDKMTENLVGILGYAAESMSEGYRLTADEWLCELLTTIGFYSSELKKIKYPLYSDFLNGTELDYVI